MTFSDHERQFTTLFFITVLFKRVFAEKCGKFDDEIRQDPSNGNIKVDCKWFVIK